MTAATPTASSPSRRRQSKKAHAPAPADKAHRRAKLLGRQLKERRRKLGMTQKELGVALGDRGRPVPLATISRWERGGTIEHPGMLFRALESLERERVAAETK